MRVSACFDVSTMKRHIIMKTNIPSETIRIIAGHIAGSNSPEQETRFGEWLSVPGNEAEYEKFLKIWNEIAESGEFDSEKAWEEFRSRVMAERKSSVRSFVRIIAGVAAAAAVAVVSVLGYRAVDGSGVQPVHFASVSGKSKVMLPDGSEVTLNTGSSLSYDKSFGRKARKVHAGGRAFFDVAKDSKRPFVIDIDGLEIKVLGTRFDVEPMYDKVVVSLVEGSVALTSGTSGQQRTMSAGEVAVYDKSSGDMSISKGDVRGPMLWCSDRLSFSDATLDAVCRDLSQWYGVNVVLSEELNGKGCINFTITDESLESVLSIISSTTRVHYRLEGPKSVVIY